MVSLQRRWRQYFPKFGILGWSLILCSICITITCNFKNAVESNFQLASESRLPKWVQLPSGMLQSDVKLNLFYYGLSSQGIGDVMIELTLPGKQPQKLAGKYWWSSQTAKELKTFYATDPRPTFPDPSYIVIDVNDVIDVVEHRKREQNLRFRNVAVFWMTDNPAILKEAMESMEQRK